MSKTLIKLRFQNGLTFESFKKEVFDIEGLNELYQFEESAGPDFIIFGPYGNDIPPKGNYTRIGYFCENIKPDLSICEWAFGVPREEAIKHPNYKRIQWHGVDPHLLIKKTDVDPEQILDSKTKFCNFLYTHRVPYREAFFTALSKYKKVDAPGVSMNNMPNIDTLYKGDKWKVKRQFLSPYKFTIAFENDISPGYQTEKLYDAMMAGSIPIYFGDRFVGDIFNTKSFIDAAEYLPRKNQWLSGVLETTGQMDFEDIRPAFLKNPKNRLRRKIKSYMRGYKTDLQFAKMDFTPLIERIIQLDTKPDLYLQCLAEPWFNNNTVPENTSSKKRWIEIFNYSRE
ncbi:MAG TPA: glycosyltransferase family 10 [Mucilaginibacter sp.]